MGDLVVASIAGRNRKVAEAFVTAGKVRILDVMVGSLRLRISLQMMNAQSLLYKSS